MSSRDVPEHIKQRLDKAAAELDELRAQVTAGTLPDVLLVEVSRVLAHAHWAGSVGVPSSPLGEGSRGKPGSKPPSGSGDRQARWALKRFKSDVEGVVNAYWNRVDGSHVQVVSTPRVDSDGLMDRAPRVRCGASGCRTRQPLFRVDAQSRQLVWTETCVECGMRLPERNDDD